MISVKRGDRKTISFTVNADLVGTTRRLLARPTFEITPGTVIELTHTIGTTSETSSVVNHQLDGTLAAGAYFVELEIVRGDEETTAPSEGYFLLIVEPDIG